MAIGCLGSNIIFKVSSQQIFIFDEFERKVSARWAKHDRIAMKPLKQFLGPDEDTISFTIELNAELGVKPRKILEQINNLISTGEPQTLVIGTKAIGENKFYIESCSETWERIMNQGELIKAKAKLTLEEYL